MPISEAVAYRRGRRVQVGMSMIKVHRWASCAVMLMLLVISIPASAEVVLRSDFEDAMSRQPPDWSQPYGAVWGREVVASNERAYSGSWSVKLLDDAADRSIGLRTRRIPISDPGPYRLEAWLYNDTGTGSIYLEFWDARGERIAHHIQAGATRGRWEQVVIEAAAPKEATHVTVLIYSPGAAVGTVYFDDITLTRSAPSLVSSAGERSTDGNLVVNHDFSLGVDANGVPFGWRPRGGSPNAYAVVSDERVRSGKYSLKIVDTADNESIGMYSTSVPVQPGERFRASVDVYIESGSGFILYVDFMSAATRVDAYTTIAGASPEWQTMVVEGIAPVGADNVALLLYSSGPNIGIAHFDNVSLIKVEPDLSAGDRRILQSNLPFSSEKSLGTPIEWKQLNAGALGWDTEGNPVWYFTSAGAGDDRFVAVRVADGRILGEYPFGGSGSQSWAVLPLTSGDVYFASGPNLYKFDAEKEQIVTLGRPHASTGMIWSLALAPDGIIYGATYPKARIFELDPRNDRLIDLGTVSSSEYAHGIAADERHVYVGIGPEPDIVVYDRKTGATRSILPSEYKGRSGFVTHLAVRGNRLFASAGAGTDITLVYDTETFEIIYRLSGVSWPLPPVLDGGELIFGLNSRPYRYDLNTDRLTATGLVYLTATAVGYAELDPELIPTARRSTFRGRLLVGLQTDQYWAMDTSSGLLVQVPLEFTPTPILINSLGASVGKVFGGGIGIGGAFLYDTRTGERSMIPPVGQVDALVFHDGKLYLGKYPGGQLFVYDGTSDAPQRLATIGKGQDRPVAMLSHGGLILIGSVPDYGMHGGALSILDVQTGTLRTYNNIVPNHSVVSLAAEGSVVYGGTSTLGGLGADRVPGDGALFAWDLSTESLLWEHRPLPGEPAIGALAIGGDGLIWGAGTHSIFAFDPEAKELVWQYRLRSPNLAPYGWREAFAATFGPYVLISLQREYLVVVNTDTGAVNVFRGHYDRIAVDEDGNLYFNRNAELFTVPMQEWAQLQ